MYNDTLFQYFADLQRCSIVQQFCSHMRKSWLKHNKDIFENKIAKAVLLKSCKDASRDILNI